MSVPVTVVARKNPAKQNEPEKFYAMAQAAGEMNFRSLCKDASEGCTVMRADIAAVLYALIDSMMKSLAKGEIVRFGDFGSFQVGVSSTGVEKKDDFSANQVKGAHIIFRPGIDLTEMIKTLTFKKKTVGKVVARMKHRVVTQVAIRVAPYR
ncbi:DNA-binding protein, histone-like family [Bacteroides graminisolvens DSM 19988 = JCM 15093]|uniref:DNA-binding protein, histone-like family n=1 Tax=Bacteroides graminisolvens DSM 19988 = JCM 15093 TaxID=1121097 RepID=A0A069DBE2_9BACE|nr:HU family DNA-binding protein [Bacteroides graminisolvens]GAK37579.1 DNA-binding protein, histone-like family [Bacteroides graminisolvens DSM 19988 = JCM 15093]